MINPLDKQNQTGPVSESERLISRKNRELAALVEMNKVIHSTMRLNRLLQILVEKAVIGVNLERGLLYLVEGDYLRCVAFLNRIKRDSASLITKTVGFGLDEKSVEVLAVKLGKSIYIQNAARDSRVSPKFLKFSDVREYCAVPLIGRDRVLGVLTGDKYYSQEAIQPEDIETLELFAGHISLALENAKLYEEKDRFNQILEDKVEERTSQLEEANQRLSVKMAELSTLLGMSSLLNESLEVDDILDQILSLIRDLGHGLCSIHLQSGTGNRNLYGPGFGGRTGDPGAVHLASGLTARLASAAEPMIINDLNHALALPDPVRAAGQNGATCCLAVPLLVRESISAVLLIMAADAAGFTSERREFFAVFGQQAAMALEKALVLEELIRDKHSVERRSRRLEEENRYLRDRMGHDFREDIFVSASPAMQKVMATVSRVAPTETTVTVYGETGTGKELIARAIHALSPRRDKQLITVNCAAIPDELLESEFFGHEKGAFTGAHQKRIGMFELANHGTIFLDEIGELPFNTQQKLLRVLQEHEIQPLGAKGPVTVDTRVIAATNRDLKAEMEAGRFRTDLYYRLNVFPVHLPPLRDRREDIPKLVELFVKRHRIKAGQEISLSPEVSLSFLNYRWPGNIRQLENIIERLSIIADGQMITGQDLPQEFNAPPRSGGPVKPLKEAIGDLKRELINQALAQTGGNKSAAARLLGLAPPNLSRLLRNLNMT